MLPRTESIKTYIDPTSARSARVSHMWDTRLISYTQELGALPPLTVEELAQRPQTGSLNVLAKISFTKSAAELATRAASASVPALAASERNVARKVRTASITRREQLANKTFGKHTKFPQDDIKQGTEAVQNESAVQHEAVQNEAVAAVTSPPLEESMAVSNSEPAAPINQVDGIPGAARLVISSVTINEDIKSSEARQQDAIPGVPVAHLDAKGVETTQISPPNLTTQNSEEASPDLKVFSHDT